MHLFVKGKMVFKQPKNNRRLPPQIHSCTFTTLLYIFTEIKYTYLCTFPYSFCFSYFWDVCFCYMIFLKYPYHCALPQFYLCRGCVIYTNSLADLSITYTLWRSYLSSLSLYPMDANWSFNQL